jgi:hypothetical protein
MTSVTHPVKVSIDQPATFGCSTDIKQPYRWHWMKDGKVIGGSNSAASYQTPPVRLEDFGAKYSVTIWGRDGAVETSAEVTLSKEAPQPAPAEQITEAQIEAAEEVLTEAEKEGKL